MATFEFIVEGPAISLRSSKKNPPRYQRWISKVRAAALATWPSGDNPVVEEVGVEVIISNYFLDEPPDIDNIIKPIMDALNGVVYEDDRQVFRVTSQKIDVKKPPTPIPSPIVALGLAQYRELVYVIVRW